MMQYTNFFRKFGVRQASQLQAPPMTPLARITLPNLSILHYVSNSAVNLYPDEHDLLFHDYTTPIMVENVTDLRAINGAPRRSIQPNTLIPHFFSKSKRFRKMVNVEAFENAQKTLVIYNYGFMNKVYTYPRQAMSLYNRWFNIQTTVWKKIEEVTRESRREHFLMIDTPTHLPSTGALTQVENYGGIKATMLHVLNTPEQFFICELWRWLGKHRERSMMNVVPADKLHLVNIIFREAGRFTVLNLGVLNEWRKSVAEGEEHSGISPQDLQKRVLHFCMNLSEAASLAGDSPEADGDTFDTSMEITHAQPNVDGKVLTKTDIPVALIDDGHDSPINEPEGDESLTLEISDAQAKQIDQDLQQLETVWLQLSALKSGAVKELQALQDDAHQPSHVDLDIEEEEAEATLPGIKVNGNGERIPEYTEPAVERAHEILGTAAIIAEHDLTAGVKKITDRLTASGLMSAGEQRRYLEQSTKFKTLPAPAGSGTLETYAEIHPEVIKIEASASIPDIETVVDKTMLKSSLHQFDSTYVKEVLHKDVANAVLNFQNAGLCVTEFEVEHDDGLLGATNNYMVRVNPVEGAPSTLRFKLPHVESDGTYTANGVKYRARKQQGPTPIQKTSPTRVALTSYYGKVMVDRSDKKVNDYGFWLRNQIMVAGLDVSNYAIFDLHPNSVFLPRIPVPKLYSDIAQGFASFSITSQVPIAGKVGMKFHLNFDYSERLKLFDTKIVQQFEKEGLLICGNDEHLTQYIAMDQKSNLWMIGSTSRVALPSIEALLGLDQQSAPIDIATVAIMGRALPLALVLGYYQGLEPLLHALKARYRVVLTGKRLNMESHEYAIRFEDESLILDRRDRFATMILAGLNEFANAIKQYSLHDFNRKGVYLSVLETKGASVRWIREMDLLDQLFIDPITRELLVEMQEPTSFVGLLLKANEMLLTNTHPREQERTKGYERFAGAVYGELVQAIRTHSGKPGRSKMPIDLHPFAVWKNIAEDPSKNQVVDTNPIQNLKEMEAVTYGGHGGRSSRTMVKHTRAYEDEDKGTISEATVDSGDVGINIYTSADPQFASLRGLSKPYNDEEGNPTALLSTSALNAVGADRDDPKRVNFINIQNSHMLSCNGYHIAPVRTGYEQVIPHRTGDMYATTAKQDGVVVSADDHGLIVEYQDGSKQAIELGRRYGAAAGLTVPHEVQAAKGIKTGKKFKRGEALAFNPGFFDHDPLNPGQIAMKSGVMVKVAFMESPLTLEDSCLISRNTANKLKTNITKPRTIVVDFKQGVSRLVMPGTTVGSEDILCVIEDSLGSNQSLFDSASLDTLRALSAQTPTAKSAGTVERVEVYYNGDKEDMSESLRKLIKITDGQIAKRMASIGKSARTGQVDEGFRNEGNPLLLNTAAIRIYITKAVPSGVGDKLVFANQLKSVIGEVSEEDLKTESGVTIDAIFGSTSVEARIVNSPDIIGTTMTLLRIASVRAVKAYHS